MHNITVLALTFAVCLATIIVVVAIPVGITIAEALRMGWHISGQAFIFVLAGAVGVSVFCAQLIKVQRGA